MDAGLPLPGDAEHQEAPPGALRRLGAPDLPPDLLELWRRHLCERIGPLSLRRDVGRSLSGRTRCDQSRHRSARAVRDAIGLSAVLHIEGDREAALA
jgi:hypothetical protein